MSCDRVGSSCACFRCSKRVTLVTVVTLSIGDVGRILFSSLIISKGRLDGSAGGVLFPMALSLVSLLSLIGIVDKFLEFVVLRNLARSILCLYFDAKKPIE